MTGEWEFKLRQMEHGKFPREKFMAEVVDTTRGIVDRVKTFEEDDSAARMTDILSPTDGEPLIETLRGYKSKDGELMIYKVIGNRKMSEAEVRDLLVNGQIGPLDGFRSKAGKAFSAVLRYNKEEKKAEFVFDGQRDANGPIKIDFTGPETRGRRPRPAVRPRARRSSRRRKAMWSARWTAARRRCWPGARSGSSRGTSPSISS